MKKTLTIVTIIAILTFSGCTWLQDLFGNGEEDPVLSSEALVTSFTAERQVGDTEIDADAKTITLTLEPMPAENAVLTIEVSENATFDEPVLEDGVGVEFSVTAEDGTEVVWTAIASVQYGMSFQLDNNYFVLPFGIEDSSGNNSDELLVDNMPFVFNQNDEYWVYGLDALGDLVTLSAEAVVPGCAFLCIDSALPFDEQLNQYFSFVFVENDDIDLIEYSDDTTGGSVSVSNFSVSKIHGADCSGHFEGTIGKSINSTNVGLSSLESGFFKVRYVNLNDVEL